MIKWVAVAVLVAAGLTASHDHIEWFVEDSNNIKTVDGIKCSRLEGSSSDCLACYTCDHEKIKTAKNKTIKRLQLSYSNCTKDELCCFFATDLQARSHDGNCGKRNPQGNPRVSRPSLRAVLEREYAWRAWIYSQDKLEEPICAASYINPRDHVLLTTASCINGYQASALRVKFTKTQEIPYLVRDLIIHEGFSASAGGNMNDIAMLILTEHPEKRVQYVCVEPMPAPSASSCVVVSDSETSINVIVPQLKKCAMEKVKVDNNVTCTYMVASDYIPQQGAGLYCLSQHFDPPAYTLQGIYQSYQNSGPIAIYTSVAHYTQWITKTIGRIKKSYNHRRHDNHYWS